MTVRRLRIDLAYDGTDFHGWQFQPGSRTVQGTVERALGRLQGGRPVRLRGAGRTDAGVHARRQVADGLFEAVLDDSDVLYRLRRMLPGDIAVLDLCTVPDGFHSLRQARAKTYRYRLDRSAHGDPFLRCFTLHHPRALDRGALDRALARLHGTHDWRGFAAAGTTVRTTVRTLHAARYRESSGVGCFEFTAEGFLYHMVRNLVGTLLEVGCGCLPEEHILRVLAEGDRSLAGPTAAARGLILWEVDYGAAWGRAREVRPG